MSIINIAYRLIHADEEHHGWEQFVKEKYEGGHKKVENPDPDPDTHKKYPIVTFNTALKHDYFRKYIDIEFQHWKYTKDLQKKPQPSTLNGHEHSKALMGKYTVEQFNIYDEDASQKWRTALEISRKRLDTNINHYNKKLSEEIAIKDPDMSIEQTVSKQIHSLWHCHCIKQRTQDVKNLSPLPKMVGGLSDYCRIDEYFQKQEGEDIRLIVKEWVRDNASQSGMLIQGILSKIGVSGSKSDDFEDWEDPEEDDGDDVPDLTERFKNGIKDRVTGMYAYQQAVFKHLGITQVTLYRGVSDPSINNDPPPHGTKVRVKSRPASSWSANPEVALRFGSRIIQCKVPIERILMSAVIAPSMDGGVFLNESEYVVMGSEDLESEIFSVSGNPMLPVDPDDPKCKEVVDTLIKLYSSERE